MIYQLSVDDSPVLTDFSALGHLQTCSILQFRRNPLLTGLPVMPLTTLDTLEITDNPVLANLAGLQNVELIPGAIMVENNPALASFGMTALQTLSPLGANIRVTTGNTSLPACMVNNLQFQIGQAAAVMLPCP